MIEHKAMPLGDFRVVDDEKGVIEALVSVTGLVDEVKDLIEPGAYVQTLKTRTPKGVWSHDWATPVSKTLESRELMPGDPALPKTQRNGEPWPKAAGGLLIKTQFNLDTQRGREAYADVKFFGAEAQWSVGYQVPPQAATVDSKTGVRHIAKMELFEYSPVLFGAMPLAATTSVKTAQLAAMAVSDAGAGDGENGTLGHKTLQLAESLGLTDDDLALIGEVKSLVAREDAGETLDDDEIKALFDVATKGVEDTPGDVSATERLKRYWAHGEGAAKVRWGTDGDFDRCVRHVRKFMPKPGEAEGYCAERHHDALGIWPATHAKLEREAHAGKDGEPGDVETKDIATDSVPPQTTSGFGKTDYLKCPKCGANDPIRQDGHVVCASCGAQLVKKFKEKGAEEKAASLPLDPDGFVAGLEAKAGRVLSSSNANAIKNAVETLVNVLESAGIVIENDDDADADDGNTDAPLDETDIEQKSVMRTAEGARRFHVGIGQQIRAAAHDVEETQYNVADKSGDRAWGHLDRAMSSMHDAANHADAGRHDEAHATLSDAQRYLRHAAAAAAADGDGRGGLEGDVNAHIGVTRLLKRRLHASTLNDGQQIDDSPKTLIDEIELLQVKALRELVLDENAGQDT